MSERAAGLGAVGSSLLWGRLGIGLTQGIALWLLKRAGDHHLWPATDPAMDAGLVQAAGLAPLVLLAGLGAVRRPTLAAWTAAAAAIAFVFAHHSVARQASSAEALVHFSFVSSIAVLTASAAMLFIANHLIAPADIERRWVARYPAYFDLAWTHAVQLLLSLLFASAFWAVLMLGVGLFKLIKIDALWDLVKHDWFWIPVTTVVFAAAVHLTDVRSRLTLGLRTIVLVLLAWLLPLLTTLIGAFLLSLPFTGLKPLFATSHAAGLLLGTAAWLVVLINAAYQDGRGGEEGRETPRVLRWAALAAAGLLPVLTAIAAVAVGVRVREHGWTPERIVAASLLLIAAAYAAGYAFAAVRSLTRASGWMRGLERVNVAVAVVILAVIFALATPLADPARLAVADQRARLDSGRVAPDKFDWDFLRFRSADYGTRALKALTARRGGGRDAQIAKLAGKAQARRSPWEDRIVEPRELSGALAARIVVWPKGAKLPADFLTQDWRGKGFGCLSVSANVQMPPCDARVQDVDGDGSPEVLLLMVNTIHVFKRSADGVWTSARDTNYAFCGPLSDLEDGFRRQGVGMVASRWPDLVVAGQTLPLNAPIQACPSKPFPQRAR